MEDTTSHERMNEENGFIDLTDSMNSSTLEEVKQLGPVGAFVKKLLEKGRAEKQKVYIKGLDTLTYWVRYGNDQVSFMLKPSVDQGDAPIEHAHYEMRMVDFKKPWVRSLINPNESREWLRISPINFANFCEELTGKDLRLFTLEEQFPKLTYNEMRTVIDEETSGLDEFFNYKTSGQSAGAWGFYMMFKSEELFQKYLQNDPELMDKLRNKVSDFVPKILARLQELNGIK